MFCLLPAVVLLLPILPTLISAQCNACDSYIAALKSCQTTSANVSDIGTTMDSTTLHCMCTSRSGVTQMSACQGCEESSPNASLDVILLSTWTTTCMADGQFGDQQAVICWESQPSNFLPCLSKTSGGGSGSGNLGGGTNGGSDVASTSAVGGATSSSTGQSATRSPTTTAKSNAVLSLQAPALFLVLLIGLGTVIEL